MESSTRWTKKQSSESCSDLDVLEQTVCFAFRDDDAGASELKYVGEGRRP